MTLFSISTLADETASEKTQTAADSAGRNTKQTVRKAKKKIRDKTGQQDRVKDAKDNAQSAGEDVSDKAKELKRKAD